MTARAKITSRGQVTIPKDVRERLGLRPGDEVELVEDQGGFRLQKHLAGHDPDELVEQMRER